VDLVNRDFIVVLGAAVRPGGRASPALRRRVEHAVDLWRQRPDVRLVLTGGLGRFPPAEAEVMARFAESAGVPRERMLLESRATTTRESARFCAALLAEYEVRRVVIVTDAYHQRRARLAFRRAGLRPVSSSPSASSTVPPRVRVRRVLREWVGLAWYGLTFRG